MLNRIKKLSPGIKASIAFFLSSLIVKGISYISTPFLTRLLSTEEYGQLSLYYTWSSVFGIIAMFSLMNGVFNNGMSDFPEDRDNYSYSVLVLSNVITISFSALLLAIYPFIIEFVGLETKLIVVMCLLFLVQPAYSFWIARQRYELKYKASFFWSILISTISSGVSITALFFVNDDKVFIKLLFSEGLLALFYFGFYLYLGFKNKFKVDTKYWKFAFLFNLPLIPHYLSAFLLNSSDKIMIGYLIGKSEAGFYSVAYSVAAIATIVWSAINGSLLPYTYEKCKTKDFTSINKVTIPLVALFALGCVYVILLAPEVIKIISTSEYYEALLVIPPVVGGVFFQVQYYIYANLIYFYKKPYIVMISSIFSTILNITLNYFFIREYGYIAAGYTTLFCFFIQALLDYIGMRLVVKEKVYNMVFVLIISIVVVFIALFGSLLYDFLIARLIIVIVITLLLVVFSKKIIMLFKNMKV